MSFQKNNGFKGKGAKTAGNSGDKAAPVRLEDYKAKVGTKEDGKGSYSLIASQSQFSDSGNKTFSLNYAKIQELIEEGVLTVNDKGYINNIYVFQPFNK